MQTAPISVSIDEAIRLTGLKRRKLTEYIANGALRSSKVEGRRLIHFESLSALVLSNTDSRARAP